MPLPLPPSTGFFRIVRLLLRYARLRARGRRRHQRKLLQQRRGRTVTNPSRWSVLFATAITLVLQILFAVALQRGVATAVRVNLEEQDILLVPYRVMRAMDRLEAAQRETPPAEILPDLRENLDDAIQTAVRRRSTAQESGPSAEQIKAHFHRLGSAGFATGSTNDLALAAQDGTGLIGWVGFGLLLWWFAMITCQGEGIDVDALRRRHPMWEWLLSHPVPPGAVFMAEMLSPWVSNPFVLAAPGFWIVLFKFAGHPLWLAVLAGVAVGLPLTLAASCLTKALEVNALLRFAPRSRGAVLGLMAWFGLVSVFGFMAVFTVPGVLEGPIRWLASLRSWPDLPVFSWFLGYHDGEPVLWLPVALAWGVALVLAAVAVWFSARATRRGLAGGFESVPATVAALSVQARHGRGALIRKELLWFWRDRSAVVQAILIPATLAGFQLLNLRQLLHTSSSQWSWLCSISVIFGTYFLLILGPRSLLSEGAALWIPLTWPRGLEDLLQAKARLWWIIASIPFGVGVVATLCLFPAAWWQVALISVGWWFFSRSLAQKTITLVQPANTSGETEPVPPGRRYAAWLGTFTFASGILSQQWHLAFVGVVYSWITAAAMWQNFRARVPFLFDPWSEKLPHPPTVLHGMVAIFALIEAIALISAIVVGFGGKEHLWMSATIAYGVAGLATCWFTAKWLKGREVSTREIWCWPNVPPLVPGWRAWLLGLGSGLGLGLFGWLYVHGARQLSPEFAEALQKTGRYFAENPGQRWWLLVLAVFCAPLAEEYLFRGLLFRALDREWGGWPAVLGSAGFFTIYHPPGSWVPVALVGVVAALVFRSTRSLGPGILCHAVYNSCVIWF